MPDADPVLQSLHAKDVWIFDLDNTLYPASCNLFDQIDWNMTRFIAQLLGLPELEARKVQKSYFREHGTTMRGLMSLHDVDPKTFLDYVHDIDLSPVEPSPRLNAALDTLPGRKLIFTNGDVPHAERVMDKLGVRHHFDGIFDIVAAGYVPKPTRSVYDTMVSRHNVDPQRAVMIEDMARNLVPAHELGMTTVWVRTDCAHGRDRSEGPHVHHVTDDLCTWLEQTVRALSPQPAAS